MKIGIIGSGFEMFPLMEVLNQYEHDYHIFCDWQMRPWGDKSPELRKKRCEQAMDYLADKVDAFILPPLLELELGDTYKKKPILSLFQTYLREHALKYSIVGKLGLLCEHADMEQSEKLLKEVTKWYKPTEHQQALAKKFNSSFPTWKKDVRMRTYFLTTYGSREPMVNTTIKHDLRYFHDAAVDTLIPLSRGFMFYQRLISQKTNRKKIRFHGLDAVAISFEKLVWESDFKPSKAYSVTIHCTDTTDVLLAEKKWQWILWKGKTTKIDIESVKM